MLGAAGTPADLPGIAARASDDAPEVRVAVAAALSRVGDDTVRAEVAADLTRLGRSPHASDRALAALMLGAVPTSPGLDRTALRTLLTDPEPDVVNAALAALRWPDDASLVAEIASHLDDRRTGAAAVDALVRVGEAALAVIDDGLRAEAHGHHVREMLVRAAREIGGPAAGAMLLDHVGHHDREVGLAVMRALAAFGGSDTSTTTRPADVTEAVVREDLEHATHALRALVAFENEPAASLQNAALRDELELIRQRVLAAFSMRHATEGFGRVVFQLAQRDPRSHALALEWLDVTLTGTDRAAVALLEPRLSDRERLNALSRTFSLAPLSTREILLELVQDRDGRWRRPWVKACALYTASGISTAELEAATAAAIAELTEVGTDAEEIVHETLAGIRHRRLDLV